MGLFSKPNPNTKRVSKGVFFALLTSAAARNPQQIAQAEKLRKRLTPGEREFVEREIKVGAFSPQSIARKELETEIEKRIALRKRRGRRVPTILTSPRGASIGKIVRKTLLGE